jgi:ABC-2 type transport system ATP-binding protein
MRILMRQEAPDQGDGIAFGQPFSGLGQGMNGQIAYVSESIDFQVKETIEGFFRFFGGFYPNWDHAVFLSFLATFRLDPRKRFGELSRGQKMQTAFAAAAAMRPKVIFLDEITAVLDASARTHVMNYLAAFCEQGGSVIMATNIASEVVQLRCHLWLLQGGTLQINQPIDDVTAAHVKLRKGGDSTHPLFECADCVSIGYNSDGSESFVIPERVWQESNPVPGLLDRRGIDAEDLFVYFTRRKGEYE